MACASCQIKQITGKLQEHGAGAHIAAVHPVIRDETARKATGKCREINPLQQTLRTGEEMSRAPLRLLDGWHGPRRSVPWREAFWDMYSGAGGAACWAFLKLSIGLPRAEGMDDRSRDPYRHMSRQDNDGWGSVNGDVSDGG